MIKFKAKTPNGEIIKSALSPFTFPAGEAHTKREDRRELERTEIAIIFGSPEEIHDDLFLLAMWNDVLIKDTTTKPRRVLVLPYFPGARADRGAPYGAKIYADFISRLHLDQVLIYDPHSQVIIYEFSGSIRIEYPSDFLPKQLKAMQREYVGIIAPDAGAEGRAKGVAHELGLPVFTATKSRDFETGKLTGFQIEELPAEGNLLIVDDICDGGGTFKGLAEASGLPKDRLDLYISHGVFSSNALLSLPKYFSRVITTNSYNPGRDLNRPRLFEAPSPNTFHRIDIISHLIEQVK